MSVQIDISKSAGNWPDESVTDRIVSTAVGKTMAHLGLSETATELSILLTDDQEIAVLNTTWREKSSATNVLSFPAMEIKVGETPGPMLGDIVLAFETIEHEAKLSSIGFNEHLTHLIVHGLLHLLGYDHEEEADAEQMESLEIEILAKLGIGDPYEVPVSDS